MEHKETIFETIPNHYYPYYIRLYNLFSFEYINKLISPSVLGLFSISRVRGYGKHRRSITYTATYNIYYQYYSFNDMKFTSYDDLLNYIYYYN
jgi:hypothetical protein